MHAYSSINSAMDQTNIEKKDQRTNKKRKNMKKKKQMRKEETGHNSMEINDEQCSHTTNVALHCVWLYPRRAMIEGGNGTKLDFVICVHARRKCGFGKWFLSSFLSFGFLLTLLLGSVCCLACSFYLTCVREGGEAAITNVTTQDIPYNSYVIHCTMNPRVATRRWWRCLIRCSSTRRDTRKWIVIRYDSVFFLIFTIYIHHECANSDEVAHIHHIIIAAHIFAYCSFFVFASLCLLFILFYFCCCFVINAIDVRRCRVICGPLDYDHVDDYDFLIDQTKQNEKTKMACRTNEKQMESVHWTAKPYTFAYMNNHWRNHLHMKMKHARNNCQSLET